MNPQLVFYIVSLVTAGLILVLGVVILTGALLPLTVSANYRLIMGALMVVYGGYRVTMAIVRIRSTRHQAGPADHTRG